jgi:hypothetical protein
MNRRLLLIALAGIVLPAAAADPSSQAGAETSAADAKPIAGSGRIIDDARTLPEFVALRAADGIDVQLKASAHENVTVRSDDNIVPLIETRVVAGDRPVLEISMRQGSLVRPSRTPRVIVEFRRLDDVSMHGSGDLRADRIEAERFALSMGGSGDAHIDRLNVTQLAAVLGGSGDLTVSGAATEQAYRLAGSGDVRAAQLRGQHVMVSIAGSGNASISAAESLNVSIHGSGDVVYRGSPRLVKRIEGSGRVRKRH